MTKHAACGTHAIGPRTSPNAQWQGGYVLSPPIKAYSNLLTVVSLVQRIHVCIHGVSIMVFRCSSSFNNPRLIHCAPMQIFMADAVDVSQDKYFARRRKMKTHHQHPSACLRRTYSPHNRREPGREEKEEVRRIWASIWNLNIRNQALQPLPMAISLPVNRKVHQQHNLRRRPAVLQELTGQEDLDAKRQGDQNSIRQAARKALIPKIVYQPRPHPGKHRIRPPNP